MLCQVLSWDSDTSAVEVELSPTPIIIIIIIITAKIDTGKKKKKGGLYADIAFISFTRLVRLSRLTYI